APGHGVDEDALRSEGRQPEAVAAEGNRSRTSGLDPRAALAWRRQRVRPAPEPELPSGRAEAGEVARASLRVQRTCAGGRRVRDRWSSARGAEDEGDRGSARGGRRATQRGAERAR